MIIGQNPLEGIDVIIIIKLQCDLKLFVVLQSQINRRINDNKKEIKLCLNMFLKIKSIPIKT